MVVYKMETRKRQPVGMTRIIESRTSEGFLDSLSDAANKASVAIKSGAHIAGSVAAAFGRNYHPDPTGNPVSSRHVKLVNNYEQAKDDHDYLLRKHGSVNHPEVKAAKKEMDKHYGKLTPQASDMLNNNRNQRSSTLDMYSRKPEKPDAASVDRAKKLATKQAYELADKERAKRLADLKKEDDSYRSKTNPDRRMW